MTVSTPTLLDGPELDALARRLLVPVWNALSSRADALRRSLPPRPDAASGRYEWWRALDAEQARRAALLDRLNALCGHLAGRPALGYDPSDPMPDEALEEADGFVSEPVAALVAVYRGRRADRSAPAR
ncbi:hypothetical protein [Streptomyces rimosus]|uniref:hypothetical protein n=1 Tax=Streptomyces rimosus TaxID=1927 RepID=UPI000AAF1A95|nr:hypothetical protein [Streptomyces rimosus]